MNKITKALYCFFSNLLPIKKNVVLFSSFYGQYNDNPKAVSEKLYNKNSNVEIVWVTSKKCREVLPQYVKKVKVYSKEYYKYSCRAQVVVDNHMGLRASGFWGDKGIRKLSALFFSRKRKKQLCISTWHGTPLKRIAADVIGVNGMKRHYTNSDYVVSGCDLTKNALKSAYFNSVPVKDYGTPRNDILFNLNNVDTKKIKEKLKLPSDKKIVLFAPTFRDTVENSGKIQMETLDFDKLFSVLDNKFGKEWCFVFRVHQNVLLKLDTQKIAEKYGDRVVSGNLCDDMAEYLSCTDVLITDYSGSMFDFALTGKPCFLYSHDLKDYENKERGFYIDYQSLPYPKATLKEELYNEISQFDFSKYSSDVKEFLSKISNVEDGNASERIVEDILAFIDGKPKEEII